LLRSGPLEPRLENGIRSAITKSYGETDGLKYYSLFKPYFKIISALK
jgi:hypothetical protein